MNDRTILIISGTNRPGSNTLKVAHLVKEQYDRQSIRAELYSLTELPGEIFDPGAYAAKPPSFQKLQQRVVESAGLHVVTPEYNGSFPGILKYFIDMLKFPESFDHKPVAFTGLSAGLFGALRSIEQLQMIFGYRNAHLYPDRIFIPGVSKQLDASGRLIDPELEKRLGVQVVGFAKFAGLIREPVTGQGGEIPETMHGFPDDADNEDLGDLVLAILQSPYGRLH